MIRTGGGGGGLFLDPRFRSEKANSAGHVSQVADLAQRSAASMMLQLLRSLLQPPGTTKVSRVSAGFTKWPKKRIAVLRAGRAAHRPDATSAESGKSPHLLL